MNEFVSECRSEWKRLGVPDPIADEMAAELAADLEEAEGEGASAEEVLGSGALDARSFATAWAVERGVVRPLPPNGHGLPRRSRLVAAIGAFALVAVVGGGLLIAASPSGPKRQALTSPDGRLIVESPGQAPVLVTPVSQRAPVPIMLALPPSPATAIVAADSNDSRADARTVGSVLLSVGITGLVLLSLFGLWIVPGRVARLS